jgi:putative addiction module component (TIGR02574 family)
MRASQIREELHQYIDNADDRLINLMYAMVHADMVESDYQLSDGHKKLLDQRLAAHETKPSSGSSWKDVKSRVKNQL